MKFKSLCFIFLFLGACADKSGLPDTQKAQVQNDILGKVPIYRQSFNSDVVFSQKENELLIVNQGQHMKEGFCAETLPIGRFSRVDESIPTEVQKRLDSLSKAVERKNNEIAQFKDANFAIYTWKELEGLQWFIVEGSTSWTVSMVIKESTGEFLTADASVFYKECFFQDKK